MRAGKARAGLRAGQACHRRWNAYGKSWPSIPEGGAVCGKAARTVLCGGRSAMSVPTASNAVCCGAWIRSCAQGCPSHGGRHVRTRRKRTCERSEGSRVMLRVSDAGRSRTVPRALAAGVRNPPMEETAMDGVRRCGARYGDLSAAGNSRPVIFTGRRAYRIQGLDRRSRRKGI